MEIATEERHSEGDVSSLRGPLGPEYVADLLLSHRCFKRGQFRLASGQMSSFYLDLRMLVGHPDAFRLVCSLLARELERLQCRAIAGVPLGGLSWAAGAALLGGWPLAYVRPKLKEYGAQRRVEGDVEKSLPLWLVDDVATTGTSLSDAARALREEGFRPVGGLVIVDRDEGCRENLAREGLELRALADIKHLL